jgi:hypothetical protein
LNWQPAPNNRLPFSLDPEKASCFWIRCKFHADHLPDDLAIILDGEDYSEVYCNGRRLENAENTTLWDFSNIKYDLAGTAKKGENILIIKAKISDYFHTRVRVSVIKNIVEPIVLTGSFASRAGKNNEIHLISIPTAVNTGDWGLQGFSGYSGTAIYKQQVDLQKGGNSIYLDLGTVNIGAEVFINGNFAGRHCWPPYHYRIDEFVKDGLNDIELKVKNTLSNLLENYDTFIDCKCGHAPSGILGPVRIVICN